MDKFNYFATPASPPVEVMIPRQVTKAKEVRAAMLQAGLTMPKHMDTFWVNWKRCKLEPDLGELLYAGS